MAVGEWRAGCPSLQASRPSLRAGCLSLRAKRSNPGRCALLTGLLRRFAPRNDGYAMRLAMTVGERRASRPSLRAERSNPGRYALLTGLLRRFAPRNDGILHFQFPIIHSRSARPRDASKQNLAEIKSKSCIDIDLNYAYLRFLATFNLCVTLYPA
jgi:hypothetical protein